MNFLSAIIDEDVLKYERVKKKGYVRMITNMGSLNLEIHCEQVRLYYMTSSYPPPPTSFWCYYQNAESEQERVFILRVYQG